MRKLVILGVACGAGLATLAVMAFALLVWPTPFRYENVLNSDGSTTMVRFSRASGHAERFSGGEWKRVGTNFQGGPSGSYKTCEDAKAGAWNPYLKDVLVPPPGCITDHPADTDQTR